MQYQKMINLFENTQNRQTKFRAKNWVEINDDARGTYSTNSRNCRSRIFVIIVMHIYL